MQYKITIPKPCQENWDTMIPSEKGRYCNRCATTVIDFTAMTDEEVQQFFINTAGQPVCGRFSNQQLHRVVIQLPENIFRLRMPIWMRFLVACTLIFGLSVFPFETTVAGMKSIKAGYHQGEPLTTAQKARGKKKKKRKKFRYIKEFSPIYIETTLGFTVTEPVSIPVEKSIFPPELPVVNDTQPHVEASIPQPAEQGSKNRTPDKQNQPVQTEFILPAALVPLKRRKK